MPARLKMLKYPRVQCVVLLEPQVQPETHTCLHFTFFLKICFKDTFTMVMLKTFKDTGSKASEALQRPMSPDALRQKLLKLRLGFSAADVQVGCFRQRESVEAGLRHCHNNNRTY